MHNKIKIDKVKLAVILMVIFSFISGSVFIVMKDLLQTIDPMTLIMYRFLGAAILIGLMGLALKKNLLKNYKTGIKQGSVYFTYFLLFTYGLRSINPAHMSFLTGLFIVLVPFIESIMEKIKLSVFNIFVSLQALLGLWLLSGGVDEISVGYILGFMCAMVFSFYVVYTDKNIRLDHSGPLTLSFQVFTTVGFLSMLWVAFVDGSFYLAPGTSIATLAYLIIFAKFLAIVISYFAQAYLSAFAVSLLITLTTINGAIMSWTLGGVGYSSYDLLGGLVILSACILPAFEKKLTPQFARVKSKLLR